jgi:hypothetical protein
MSTALIPSHVDIALAQRSIQGYVSGDFTRTQIVTAVSPLLTIVNQWSTQIPQLLHENNAPESVNLIFSIRKDLFVAPNYMKSILNIPVSELPTPFQEFQAFILSLIKAQKNDRNEPDVRPVCIFKRICPFSS